MAHSPHILKFVYQNEVVTDSSVLGGLGLSDKYCSQALHPAPARAFSPSGGAYLSAAGGRTVYLKAFRDSPNVPPEAKLWLATRRAHHYASLQVSDICRHAVTVLVMNSFSKLVWPTPQLERLLRGSVITPRLPKASGYRSLRRCQHFHGDFPRNSQGFMDRVGGPAL
jgi:hypothetical protein